jgi:uncharacterized protein
MAWNRPGLAGPETLTVTSEAFTDGKPMPSAHAGKIFGDRGLSPQLAWSAVPEGTACVLLVMQDIDAVSGQPFIHCLAAIDPRVSSVDPGALSGTRPGAPIQVFRSSMGRGYLGPAPVKGHGPHHYVFQFFALASKLTVPDGPPAGKAKPNAILAAARGPVLARGRLTGTYERLNRPMTMFSGAQVATLWRYPVKSMQGEELNAADVTAAGLLGDRKFAVVDPATGKVAGAKNPRKWPGFFYFRAAYVAPPVGGTDLPAVRITMPDGASTTSTDAELPKLLSAALGREVALSAGLEAARAEDLEDASDEVVTWEMPPGTFFDSAPLHLVTTATLDKLRVLYPAGRFEPRRFRPNIIITTAPEAEGFVENDWVGREIAIGTQVRLRVTMTTGRCVMTTLPQGDLPHDRAILRTAAQHNQAQVGVYAEVVAGGRVTRGDAVTVLASP